MTSVDSSPASPDSGSPSGSGWLVGVSLLAVYFVWGSTYLAIRFMVESIPPLLGNAIRLVTAGVVLLAFLRLRGVPPPTWRQWRNGTVAGTFLFVGGLGLVSVAEALGIGSGLAATAVATTPVWASLAGGVFGRWPGRLEWVGLAVGVVGVVVLAQEGDFASEPLGLLLVVVAPVLWSFGSVWSNHMDLPAGNMRTATFMTGGGLALVVAGLAAGEEVAPPSALSLWSLVYLTTFGSLLAFSAYAYLLRTVRPALATSYAYVNPVVAVVLGVWLGGETLTGAAWVALPLVVLSVALIARAPASTTEPPQEVV